MGTVCASALLGSLVDLDVLDNEGTGVEALGISVGLSVAEEDEDVLGGLGGPAGTGHTELLACEKTTCQYLCTFISILCIPIIACVEALVHACVCHVVEKSQTQIGPPLGKSYLGQCGRYHQRSGAWGQPPCGP